MAEIPFIPKSPVPIGFTVLASGLLLVSIYFQLPFWVMEMTDARPSPGGGEGMLAFVSLPLFFLAIVFTVVTLVKSTWKSRFSLILAGIEIVLSVCLLYIYL
jgi:hypothetical protein